MQKIERISVGTGNMQVCEGLQKVFTDYALSVSKLYEVTGISRNTIKKAVLGEPIRADKARRLVKAVFDQINQSDVAKAVKKDQNVVNIRPQVQGSFDMDTDKLLVQYVAAIKNANRLQELVIEESFLDKKSFDAKDLLKPLHYAKGIGRGAKTLSKRYDMSF